MALKKIPAIPADSALTKALNLKEASGKEKWDFSFIDLFAGIGGFRLALESLGGNCVFSSEWDKQSQDTYERNHGERPQGDITKIDPFSIPDHDILTGGFPCQTFSLAGITRLSSLGREHGMRDTTKGTLFGYTKEIITAKRPKMFILENVKNLKFHDEGRTFRTIVEHLQGLDYEVSSSIQTSVWWVPQHRERMFIVGFDLQRFDPKSVQENWAFPDPPKLVDGRLPVMKDIMEKNPDERYRLTDLQWSTLQNRFKGHQKGSSKPWGFSYDLNSEETIAKTLMADIKGGSALLIQDDPTKNPRRPTPRECARLMGFPDTFQTLQAQRLVQKQFGNAVVPPLIRHIATAMLRATDNFLPNLNPMPKDTILNVQVVAPEKKTGKNRKIVQKEPEVCCGLEQLFNEDQKT